MSNYTLNNKEVWGMDADPEATGEQLRKLRQDHGYTQKELSEVIKKYCAKSASRVVISQWESGQKLPSLSHLVFLSVLYGCRIHDILISYNRASVSGGKDLPDRDMPAAA